MAKLTAHTDIRVSIWRWLSYAAAFILVLLPFHALLTTWFGSNFGHIDLFRTWKEFMLLTMLGVVVVFACRDLLAHLSENFIFRAILLYIMIFVSLGMVAELLHKVTLSALWYSWIIDLRFLLFFVVIFIISRHNNWLREHWKALLFVPAILVIGFGLLQHYVLPADVLKHAGYGPNTVLPFQTVDQKPQFVRVQSTTRGANPLGAYMVLVLTAALLFSVSKKRVTKYAVLILTGLITLFYTYSRSAWLGTIIGLGIIGYWVAIRYGLRKWFLIGFAVLAISGTGFVVLNRNNDTVQNAFFHTNEQSLSAESSNQQRSLAIENGIGYVLHHPFGTGPGTAGPASFRNDNRAIIAENYYIQIAQEVGLFGLLLFLIINVAVGWQLWKQRQDSLSLVLFASFIGISVVNMLSHAWADDTLSLLWWGLAGVALGARPAILTSEQVTYEKNQKKGTKRTYTYR